MKNKGFTQAPSFRQRSGAGFTLIELLVVISILSLLASIAIAALNSARAKARDTVRVNTLKGLQKTLELYYDDYGQYPPEAGGEFVMGYCYWGLMGDGTCYGTPYMRFDNSTSIGFLKVLYPTYFSEGEWQDPLRPIPALSNWSPYNCRYVVLRDERDPNLDGDTSDANIQHYLLHCDLEASPELEKNDGGMNHDLFEIQMPKTWICPEWIDPAINYRPSCYGFGPACPNSNGYCNAAPIKDCSSCPEDCGPCS